MEFLPVSTVYRMDSPAYGKKLFSMRERKGKHRAGIGYAEWFDISIEWATAASCGLAFRNGEG
jgi:hypothetical protein